MNLFKIIIFGILIINFGVQGEEGFLTLADPRVFTGKALKINKQKLGDVIVSRVHDTQRVYNISIVAKGLRGLAYSLGTTENTVDFTISFTMETSESVFEDIQCRTRITFFYEQYISQLTLSNCGNNHVEFEQSLKIPLEFLVDSFHNDKIPLRFLDPQ